MGPKTWNAVLVLCPMTTCVTLAQKPAFMTLNVALSLILKNISCTYSFRGGNAQHTEYKLLGRELEWANIITSTHGSPFEVRVGPLKILPFEQKWIRTTWHIHSLYQSICIWALAPNLAAASWYYTFWEAECDGSSSWVFVTSTWQTWIEF